MLLLSGLLVGLDGTIEKPGWDNLLNLILKDLDWAIAGLLLTLAWAPSVGLLAPGTSGRIGVIAAG